MCSSRVFNQSVISHLDRGDHFGSLSKNSTLHFSCQTRLRNRWLCQAKGVFCEIWLMKICVRWLYVRWLYVRWFGAQFTRWYCRASDLNISDLVYWHCFRFATIAHDTLSQDESFHSNDSPASGAFRPKLWMKPSFRCYEKHCSTKWNWKTNF